jgi:branched-chain amino acid transport system substrate-binding protein
MQGNQFETVMGRVDFDDNGDLMVQRWIWYVWRGGEYVPLE